MKLPNSNIKFLLLLLIITITIAKETSCGQSYDECIKDTQQHESGSKQLASFYNWVTQGRSVCDDTFKLCVYLNDKKNPK